MKHKTTLAILALIVLVAAVLVYQRQNFKNNEPSQVPIAENNSGRTDVNQDDAEALEIAGDDFNAQCEKGEWLTIADLAGEKITANGILRWVDTESDPASVAFKDYTHYLDGKEKYGLVGKPSSDLFNALDLFHAREVEVEGVLKSESGQAIEVARIHCAGSETDQSALDNRAKMLNFLAENFDSIAPEKAKYQTWVLSSAMIVNNTNIYIEYYDSIEDGEDFNGDIDTSRRALLEISPKDDSFETKVLAYYEMGEDDFDLKSGQDAFKNLDIDALPSYSYDSEEDSWTRD